MLPILENKYTDDHTEDNNIKKKLTVVSATNNFLTCSLEHLHDQKWDYNCKGFVVSGHIKSYLKNYLKSIGPKRVPELTADSRLQNCYFPSAFPLFLRSLSQWKKEKEHRRSVSLPVVLFFDWKSSGGDQTLWEFKIKASNHWLQISGLQSVVSLLWSSEKL